MFLIRLPEVLRGIAQRGNGRVRVAEPELYRPACPPCTEWHAAVEIPCEGMSLSSFDHTTAQDVHFHPCSWELYIALEGTLQIAIWKDDDETWQVFTLSRHDQFLIPPKVVHVVHCQGHRCHALTIQAPPAGQHGKVIKHIPIQPSFTQGNT
jgi:mannose-6-phosphate isomerase-like protein (cupin superfamily)